MSVLLKAGYLDFAFALRLLGIVADIAVVAGLLRLRDRLRGPPWWALALFAASPVSLMVSGFHGNVDPILTALLFFAAVAAMEERPILNGILFALACNIKIVPVVFAPVFFFYWFSRRKTWAFVLATGGVLLLGGIWPLCVAPRAFLHGVFGYGSYWGVWGIPYWLRLTGWKAVQKIDFQGLSDVQNLFVTLLKVLIVASIIAVAWRRRKLGGAEVFTTLATAWILFFVFAPGVGTQYFVWLAPFVLIAAPRGYSVLTAASTVFLVAFYHITSGFHFPWVISVPRTEVTPWWSAYGNVCWFAMIGLLVVYGRRWWRAESTSSDGAGTDCNYG
jgi:uncharacterized membrane protein